MQLERHPSMAFANKPAQVARFFADRSPARNILLHIRGLMVNRIFILCLKKRFNIHYGVSPSRDPLAVPFEAKGVPSEQAEFGHPDVAIILTCLAFYYSGLNLSQFQEDLQFVLKSDNPASEYDRWTHTSKTLPERLRHWNVINADDFGQVEELHKHLGFDRTVVNHFMNTFVFPRHAKQFRVKLQLSGWDVPIYSPVVSGNDKSMTGARTTGFSGTNDNRMMLPLTIKQDDLPGLAQTNAEVLTYLLRPQNRCFHVAADLQKKRLSEQGLVRRLKELKIRILIDAGAYIMEMDNQTLVKAWLHEDTEAKAAVYVGADNRLLVQFRNKRVPIPLVATPFAENMEDCLVYLDEAHTRGTDLKLPRHAKGAVTLALGQTKDHTVQGKLSPSSFATLEVQTDIYSRNASSSTWLISICRLFRTARSQSECP